MMQAQEKRFSDGKLTLNYAELPAPGPPLLLLHGGTARWQGFKAILPELAASYHIYAPDLRGHGKSDWQPGSYRLQDYAGDIVAFLQALVEQPAFIFGHSLGGMLALLVAARLPHAVRAVAAGDAPLSAAHWGAHLAESRERLAAWRDLAGGQKTLAELITVLKDTPMELPGRHEPVPMRQVFGEDSPVFHEWLAPNLYHADPDTLSTLLDRLPATAAGYEMETLLPAIRCPVLLLQADPAAGGVMTDEEVAEALPLLAHARHVKLEGMSHALYNERKEPVLAALEDFFQRHW
jgi:pimeloyl-ACP methyl ester carboxylesterase